MRTTIDRAGRVVVPKAIRAQLHLLGGGEVEITERGGVIEMVPLPAEVDVVGKGADAVAMPSEPLPPLSDADVQAAIDRTRR